MGCELVQSQAGTSGSWSLRLGIVRVSVFERSGDDRTRFALRQVTSQCTRENSSCLNEQRCKQGCVQLYHDKIATLLYSSAIYFSYFLCYFDAFTELGLQLVGNEIGAGQVVNGTLPTRTGG